MKALTLYDPWATLVVLGKKQYESRSWGTKYRGPLAIHVSTAIRRWMEELYDQEPFRSALVGHRFSESGCIIGTVELLGCFKIGVLVNSVDFLTAKERAFGDYTPERWAWSLGSWKRLANPIPCRGRQRLWNVPEGVEEELKRARYE